MVMAMALTLKRRRVEEELSIEKFARANCVDIMKRNESLGRRNLCLFKCKECKKQFDSFQALGGHRTSHKNKTNKLMTMSTNRKHVCSICGEEFAIGQALGGHMGKHRDALKKKKKLKENSKSSEFAEALRDSKMNLKSSERMDMGSDSSSAATCSFRVAVVQASTVFYDTPATLEKAEKLLIQATSDGAQQVVFPEAFIGGYPHGSYFGVSTGSQKAEGSEDCQKYHASAINVPGPEVERLAEMAGNCKVYLVMGVIEKDGCTLYSTVLFFDSSGLYLGKHRNIMPTPLERILWGYGDVSTIPVFDTPIGKIGAAIFREIRMPLLRTAMYAKGIEICCAPTTARVCRRPAGKVWRDVWKECMTHAALEGGCYVLSASQSCPIRDGPFPPEHFLSGIDDLKPDSVDCNGGSAIISPSGVVLAGPYFGMETVLYANLDRREIALAKLDFDVAGNHARPDVFSLIVMDHPVSSASGVKKKRTAE